MSLLGTECLTRCHPSCAQVPLPSHSASLLIEDEATAKSLYQLAKSSNDAEDFTARLQQAGLMAQEAAASSAQPDGEPRSGDSGGGAGGGTDESIATHTEATDVGVGGKGGGAAAASKGAGGRLVVPQLSRELAHRHARDGIIIVTWANFHFFDFVLNWVHHMELHGITNYMVGAMDADTGQVGAAAAVAGLLALPCGLLSLWRGACSVMRLVVG
jgi:hypothetical protein